MENSNQSEEIISFKRFLSYIYAYEDDVKLRNVGFAKVEIRKNRVKIQIIINGVMAKGGRPLTLSLVNMRGEKIPVSQMHLQNGHGEFFSATNMENMWNSGAVFSKVCGLHLQGAGSRRHYYMTLWKNVVDNEEEEEQEMLHACDSQLESIAAKDLAAAAETGNQKEKPETLSENTESVLKASTITLQQTESQESTEEEQAITNSAMELSGMDTKNSEVKWSERETEASEVRAPEREAEASEVRVSEREAESSERQSSEMECLNPDMQMFEMESEIRTVSANVEDGPEEISTVSVQAYKVPQRKITCVKVQNDSQDQSMLLWKKLCSRYPHVDIRPVIMAEAAECGRVAEAIRIRPNDIGRLPRANWGLAHNSFLRHTYNCYHQLILFRMEEKETENQVHNRWFIGLPGENSDQETLVAGVFGFEKYLNCKNGGYWYREICLSVY